MTAYLNEPDHTGHSYYPNSTQVMFTYIRTGEFTKAVLLKSYCLW